MPYVNCPECGVRTFALAPWSAVKRCPSCEAPLSLPRQSAPEDQRQPTYWRGAASPDIARRRSDVQGTR